MAEAQVEILRYTRSTYIFPTMQAQFFGIAAEVASIAVDACVVGWIMYHSIACGL